MVARFVRLQPIHWRGGASAKIQVMGCQTTKTASRRRTPEGQHSASLPIHPFAGSGFLRCYLRLCSRISTRQSDHGNQAAALDPQSLWSRRHHGNNTKYIWAAHLCSTAPWLGLGCSITQTLTLAGSRLHLMVVVVGVVLGLVVCGSFMVAGVWFKRRYTTQITLFFLLLLCFYCFFLFTTQEKRLPDEVHHTLRWGRRCVLCFSHPKFKHFDVRLGCQSIKSLSCPASEVVYPLQRNVHDALPAPPLNGEPSKHTIPLCYLSKPRRFISILHLKKGIKDWSKCRELRAWPHPTLCSSLHCTTRSNDEISLLHIT